MADFDTYITEEGFKTLLNNGLLNSITSFNVSDASIIYGVEEDSVKPNFFTIPLTGNREGTTKIPTCSFSQRKPIPITPPRSEEIQTLDSRVKLSFVSENCSIPFEKNNITVRVNIDKWIDDLSALKSTDYSRKSSGLKIKIWDYISAYLEEYNYGTKTWDVTETYQSNLDVSYRLPSAKDVNNYKLVNPKYMELTTSGIKKFVNRQTSNRFPSNMILSFDTMVIDGVDVFGTSNTLGLIVDRWGYVADGSFLNTGDVENKVKSNPGAYKQIYPAIMIDDKIYQYKENKNLESVDGVAYMVHGFKDNNNKPAIDGLTDKLKLFMKANGEEVSTGVYRFVINFMLDTKSGKKFNRAYQNKKVGGELTYELYYNVNTVSTELIIIN
jgi:hypothetical protein